LKYKINTDNVSWKEVDNQIIIINFENTHYYSLNTSGAYLWKIISENPLHLAEITQKFHEEFGDIENLDSDINTVMNNLIEENLILTENDS